MTDQIFLDGKVTLKAGDCLEVLKSLPDCSIESCVTDPPYHLTSIVKRFGGKNAAPAQFGTDGAFARASRGFMGRVWDGGDIAFRVELWAEVWRVLKPGGWLAAFSATRTYHRMAVAIEDAGFDIRDDILNMVATDSVAMRFVESLNEAQTEAFFKLLEESQFGGMAAWTYGSGFPKSHDVSKAIDKAAGAVREVIGKTIAPRKALDANPDGGSKYGFGVGEIDVTAPATDAARQWQGWGTALKPAWEPICLARKPLIGTVAENVLEHGTGALNVDGCRVGTEGESFHAPQSTPSKREGVVGKAMQATGGADRNQAAQRASIERTATLGRWPANIVHDGSDEVLACFPDSAGNSGGIIRDKGADSVARGKLAPTVRGGYGGGEGSAARFFYTAKADKKDRIGSKHPTVKPVDLCQWLVRLVTPKGGVVLDPFAGSGTTGEAAWREGMRAILIEREEEYQADIAERLRLADKGPVERTKRVIKQASDIGPLFANDNQAASARGEAA